MFVQLCYVNAIYENTFKTRSQTSVNKHNPTCEMCFILFPVSFSMKKCDHNVKLNWLSMIFIFGVISIIIQKNTLCINKIRLIYFWQNYVIFLPKNVHGCRPQVCNFVNPIQDGGGSKKFFLCNFCKRRN